MLCHRNFILPEQVITTAIKEPKVPTSAKLIKIGAKVVRHSRYAAFRMAEVVVAKELFREVTDRIGRLRASPEFAGAG